MIEARNFYWKEATEGEPRSTHEEKGEKLELCRSHPLMEYSCVYILDETYTALYASRGHTGEGRQTRKQAMTI